MHVCFKEKQKHFLLDKNISVNYLVVRICALKELFWSKNLEIFRSLVTRLGHQNNSNWELTWNLICSTRWCFIFNINSIRTFSALWFKGKKKKNLSKNKFTVGMYEINDLLDREGLGTLATLSPISYTFYTKTVWTQIKDLVSSMNGSLYVRWSPEMLQQGISTGSATA